MYDPLTAFMRRLSHSAKFTLVGCTILLAIAIPVYETYHVQIQRIEVANSEYLWTQYAKPLIPLMEMLQLHQQAIIAAHHGDIGASHRAAVLQNQIDESMWQFNDIDRNLSETLNVQSLWQSIVQQWNSLKRDQNSLSTFKVQLRYRNMRTDIWNLIQQSSDNAQLLEDTYPYSIYEIDAVRMQIPLMMARLSQLRDELIMAQEPGMLSDNHLQLLIAMIDLSNAGAIQLDMTKAFSSNPALAVLLGPASDQLARRAEDLYMKLSQPSIQPIKASNETDIINTANMLASDVGTLFGKSMDQLNSEFKDRLQRLWWVLAGSLGLVFVVAGIMGFLFIAMYRSMVGAIMERVNAERRLRQASDLNVALSQINRLIAHRCDQDKLFDAVCRITVQGERFDLAVIVLRDPETGDSIPAAYAGHASGYLQNLCRPSDNHIPSGCQPFEACITSGSQVVINDLSVESPEGPWESSAIAHQLRSAAAFPLIKKNGVVGALVIYSDQSDCFDEQFIGLISEISNALSFALDDIDRENLRRAADQALRDSEQRYHLVMEGAGDAIVLMESDGRIVEANRRAVEQFGYSREELINMPGRTLFPEELQHDMRQRYENILTTGQTVDSCTVIVRKDKTTFPVDAVESRVELWRKQMVLSIFRDVSERKAAEERIHYLAYHDSLTGLPNRTLLIDRLEQAIRESHRRNTMVGVIFIDLDNFKTVNDTLGHDFGDELLQSAAMRIRTSLRDSDTVARLGGDEFIVLITNPDSPSDLSLVSQKINQAMSVPFVISGHTFHITCSIGMSIYPRDGQDSGVLLRTADEALYQVKKEGRNRAKFHTPEMHAEAIEHVRLENDLREALRKNQFMLHYQPQVNLQTGRIIGAEALIRWEHPERGLILPGKFIPLAEEKGLIMAMGNWILHEACAQNRKWQLAGLPIVPVSVNLSAVQCRESSLTDAIRRSLKDTGLDPQYLELEITESTLMAQTELLRSRMIEIKGLGIHFSLDDFGTGYSSLSYLTRFPIDALKIDSSFIRDMIDDPKDLAVVDTVVNLAENLQLRTIAEGVERIEQITLLKLLGCQSIQGYYFSKPVPADEFARMIMEDRRLHDTPTAGAPSPIIVSTTH
jgi:diguanylate cyclase (GGDEF)-like protein/PAS domain S-box-containing protein